jgi:hypothetical protein
MDARVLQGWGPSISSKVGKVCEGDEEKRGRQVINRVVGKVGFQAFQHAGASAMPNSCI